MILMNFISERALYLMQRIVSFKYLICFIIVFIFVVFIAICVGSIYICSKLTKKDKPFYKPKEVSHHVEFELTNVGKNPVGEYQRPTVRDVSDSDPLNTSSST